MNTATIWRTVLEHLEHSPIDAVSKTWLQDAQLLNSPAMGEETSTHGQHSGLFLLQVPNDLACDVITKRWQGILEQLLSEILSQPAQLTVISATQAPPSRPRSERGEREVRHQTSAQSAQQTYYDSVSSHTQRTPTQTEFAYASRERLDEWDNEQRTNMLMNNRLNQRYTFDAFIVGNSNRLAHAASLAVAEAPGESYNPLFLYGGVGLGKTHLLHAIGHQGVQTGLAVLYVSSEQFTNEIVNAIRYRTTEEFRAKYRSVDILLVDDIQFIAGKESTEEEFFHTFNSLYEMSKQIVICSDRPPKAIVSLEERLRSRFEWGLIADIQPPDLETRMAILRVKADLLHYHVPDEIISYIAGRVQTNIRELEGCLNRLMAYQQLHRSDLTLDVARAAISSLGNDNRETHLNSQQIAEAVAEYYHISLEAMCGKQRDKYIVMPRQIAMYLIRQETQASLLEIGQLFGGRDHSTVLHACEKIDRTLNINPTLRREIIDIREQLMRS
ncbi:chromosomal replication initiator protein DnaA [Tengunoibacter tsumagoiensis]|uniref:Chromosomal replication initiator protein DnaA n=1 Tax=Tengunoibacter tsumagoiensis TaxID=2014871 RepID=A0A401ZTK9_9CHLR|nr:chromosomal replication initiator protein DnaA [Tengunoibacter tsumagoiensis]GCE10142.1 chromosomal replication initiator protein DnaA [Tengunoibacter tsumagoiensis]